MTNKPHTLGLVKRCWLMTTFIAFTANAAIAQGTAFTYQGKLSDNGSAASGNYDFEFKLFDAQTIGTGTQQGATIQQLNVPVVNGVFTVQLDFGAAAFGGASRFLEIGVRLAGSANPFTQLSPRQPVTSTPYAIRSAVSTSADGLSVACSGCVLDSHIGSIAGSKVSGTIPVASVPAGSGSYIQNTTTQQSSSSFNISGNGLVAGNVGIGTSAAPQRLTVAGGIVVDHASQNDGTLNNTGANTALTFGQSPLTGEGILSRRTSGGNQFGLEFLTNFASRLTISHGGNVGIGTTPTPTAPLPSFKLHVAVAGFDGIKIQQKGSGFAQVRWTDQSDTLTGAISVGSAGEGMRFFLNGSDRIAVATNGNVGIGTTTPSALLHVSGDALVTGDLTVNGAFGLPSGALSASSVDSANGYKIGGSQVLVVPGFANTFAGVDAGKSIASGENNSFFGAHAGFSNDTGINNSFVGTNAGFSNTTGSHNSFFGAGAGFSNTTGEENVFVGDAAGHNNQTGILNTFVGKDSGNANTTGSLNAFFGHNAGASNTTADANAFFGVDAGSQNTTGTNNSFLGGGAGSANTTGSFNVFTGHIAGSNNTLGSFNTFVGRGSGLSNTTEDLNTFIGFGANGAAGVTDATAIGANAVVTSSHTVVLGASGVTVQVPGDLNVSGILSKGAGSFKIDHPLDPENKYLYHSFVESPDMKNVYDGVEVLNRRGEAIVTMPVWFGALNKDFRYQLTPIGAPGPNLYIAREIKSNRFKIAGGRPGMKVSWQVTGVRQDAYANAHRIPIEEQKADAERGSYLHPDAFESAKPRVARPPSSATTKPGGGQ
jgi:hypothetical protein